MTQADSVLSTPPTNTSLTRRNILGTIAAAGATALTLPPAHAAAPVHDPIFAAIEAHRKAYATMQAAFAEHRQAHELADAKVGPAHLDIPSMADPGETVETSHWMDVERAIPREQFPDLNAASVKWKQAALAAGKHEHTDVKSERIERAIADDLAFLAAHPTRRSNSEAMARSREFKEAMRQRIRDIAASRDLSDEEIRPVLKLKHHEIANFTEKHGVNLEWLLEGKGRIFKKDPIRLSPNMTGDEFVAVVATMPPADQQAIRATVREMLQERDQ
jgi:hypothetical protein